jgi:hypothetical protein
VDTKEGAKVGYVGAPTSKKIHHILDAEEGDVFYNIEVHCMAVDTPDVYETQSVVVYYGSDSSKSASLPVLTGLVGTVLIA